MRPSFRNISAWMASHPHAQYAQAVSGLTAEQAAAELFSFMDRCPTQQVRDYWFSQAMACTGVITTGLAEFERGCAEVLAELEPSRTRDATIERIAQETIRAGMPSSVDRIKAFHAVAKQSAMQQAMSDRMRTRDAQQERFESPIIPKHDRARAEGEDQRDLRAAVHAAVAGTRPDRQPLNLGEGSLRDTLRAAFDAEADRSEDPLQNESLQSLSDAV